MDGRPRGHTRRTAAPGDETADGHPRPPGQKNDRRPPPVAENSGRPPPRPKATDGPPHNRKTADGRPPSRKRRTVALWQRTAAPGIESAKPDGRPLFGAAVRRWGGGRPLRPRTDGHPWGRPSARTQFQTLRGLPVALGLEALAQPRPAASAALTFRESFAPGRTWAGARARRTRQP